MKERLLALRPYILRFVGYPLFFMFWFVTFVYVTFPYDRLKEAIVAAIEAPRRTPGGSSQPSNMQVSIGSVRPTFFPGISARDVALTFLPTKTGERSVTMRMQRVAAHVGLFALAGGNVSADIDIDGMGGRIEAHVDSAMRGARPGLRDLRVSLEHVRVGEIAPLVSMVGLPLSGSLDGTVELHVPDGQVEQSTGATHVTIDDLRIGDGHAQYQIPRFGGITIEQIRAGRLDGAITIREGRATIDRFTARSPEFTFQMDGRVDLQPVFGESVMNMGVRFQLTDAYRHKSEQAGRIMSVMDIVPDLQAARRPDGTLSFRCRGNFARGLTCPPERATGGAVAPTNRLATPPRVRRGFERNSDEE